MIEKVMMAIYILAQGILSEGSTFDRIWGNDIHVPLTDQLATFCIFMIHGSDHWVRGSALDLQGTTPDLNLGIVNRGNMRTGYLKSKK